MGTISLKDLEGQTVQVEEDSFIHYNDASLSAFAEGAIVDMDQVDSGLMTSYNAPAQTVLSSSGDKYVTDNNGYELSFSNILWKLKMCIRDRADTSAQQTILVKASSLLADAQKALDDLKNVTDAAETAKEYHDTVLPAMAALRAPIDELETIVDSEYWPVPTYGELMFEV